MFVTTRGDFHSIYHVLPTVEKDFHAPRPEGAQIDCISLEETNFRHICLTRNRHFPRRKTPLQVTEILSKFHWVKCRLTCSPMHCCHEGKLQQISINILLHFKIHSCFIELFGGCDPLSTKWSFCYLLWWHRDSIFFQARTALFLVWFDQPILQNSDSIFLYW